MSDGYQEIDLDEKKPGGKPAPEPEFEIVDEEAAPEPEATPAPAPAPAEEEDEAPPKEGRLSRSQRLKAQRDAYAAQLAEAKAALEAERAEKARLLGQNEEAASAGYDFYIQTLANSMTGLRAEFDQAFNQGDLDKLFGVQQRMAELAAEKKQAERERAARPTKAAAGGAEPKATPPTTPAAESSTSKPSSPNPLAQEWVGQHADWWGKNQVMTMAARVLDAQVASEGFDPQEPEYWAELDKRLREEFPTRLQKKAPATTPTVQHRAATLQPSTKVRVTITGQDRDMARRLGLSIEDYAKHKARREAAANTPSGYTEII